MMQWWNSCFVCSVPHTNVYWLNRDWQCLFLSNSPSTYLSSSHRSLLISFFPSRLPFSSSLLFFPSLPFSSSPVFFSFSLLGYNSMGLKLNKPYLRAAMEADCQKIMRGEVQRNDVVTACLNEMKARFLQAVNQASKLDDAVSKVTPRYFLLFYTRLFSSFGFYFSFLHDVFLSSLLFSSFLLSSPLFSLIIVLIF
jgi:hypothetical protein